MRIITKAEFSRRLGVTRGRISQYRAMGMPTLADGRLDLAVAMRWVRENIGPAYRPAGGEDVVLSEAALARIVDGD